MNLGHVRWTTVIAGLCIVALLGAAGCARPGGPTAGSAAGSGAPGVTDDAKAVETPVKAADGAVIGLKTDDALYRITIPAGALAKDAVIVVTPYTKAPGEDAATLLKGFLLEEKGTGAGPKLLAPAWVEVITAKGLGPGASMVSFGADGTAEVVPTKVKSGTGASAALALVSHFSPFAGRDVGTESADKGRREFAKYDWVVKVASTAKTSTGPIKQTCTLKLTATNKGGDIAGDYLGSATIVSTNDGSMMGGTMTGTQAGSSGTVRITLTEGDPLASLTGPDPLATLTPDEMPSWIGGGEIQMSAQTVGGPITGQMGGYGGSGQAKNTSTVPVTMTVTGTQVSLRASLPPGPLDFEGYVIGVGKK